MLTIVFTAVVMFSINPVLALAAVLISLNPDLVAGLKAKAKGMPDGDLGKLLADTTGVAWFNGLGESVSLVTGLIFIVCVLFFRRGIVGEIGGKLKLHL